MGVVRVYAHLEASLRFLCDFHEALVWRKERGRQEAIYGNTDVTRVIHWVRDEDVEQAIAEVADMIIDRAREDLLDLLDTREFIRRQVAARIPDRLWELV